MKKWFRTHYSLPKCDGGPVHSRAARALEMEKMTSGPGLKVEYNF